MDDYGHEQYQQQDMDQYQQHVSQQQQYDPSQPMVGSEGRNKIVCIGDSITHGRGTSGETMTYPAIMGQLLDPTRFEVVNLGLGTGEAAMSKSADNSIWDHENYKALLKSNANAVLIMLGTHDAKEKHWSEVEFQADYYEMIGEIQCMASGPKVFLLVPPPVYKDGQFGISQKIANEIIPAQIANIAKEMGLEDDQVISVFDALGGEKLAFEEMFIDGVHPNDEGYFRIAEFVLNKIGFPCDISQNKKEWIEHLGHSEHQYIIRAVGDLEGKVLSHAHAQLSIVDNPGGEGELFNLHIHKFPFGHDERTIKLYIQCRGGESHLFLSHANAQLGLSDMAWNGEEFHIDVEEGNMECAKNDKGIILNLSHGEAHQIFGRYSGKLMLLPKDGSILSRWRLEKVLVE